MWFMFFYFRYSQTMLLMKRVFLFLWLFLTLGGVVKAQDPTLIRLKGKEVRLSEFLWYYHQSEQMMQEELPTYFHRFVQYALKVADAYEHRLDTLPDFKYQCDYLQDRKSVV